MQGKIKKLIILWKYPNFRPLWKNNMMIMLEDFFCHFCGKRYGRHLSKYVSDDPYNDDGERYY